MFERIIHKDAKGRIYKLHEPNCFMMNKTRNSFIEEYGFYKKHSVLRVKIRKTGMYYQYHFVPLWIYWKLLRAESRGHLGYVFRNWVLRRFSYIPEQTLVKEVKQLKLEL